jgi:hypothetical protein
VNYDDFKAAVRAAAESRAGHGSLVPIPDLRQTVGLDGGTFERYVLRLQHDALVHLLTHVDSEVLPPEVREACLAHPSGVLLYWIRWL